MVLLTPQPSVYKTTHTYLLCPTATKVHNITCTPTCHTDSTLIMHSTASAYKTDPMLRSNEVAPTYSKTHSPCTATYALHTQHYPPRAVASYLKLVWPKPRVAVSMHTAAKGVRRHASPGKIRHLEITRLKPF